MQVEEEILCSEYSFEFRRVSFFIEFQFLQVEEEILALHNEELFGVRNINRFLDFNELLFFVRNIVLDFDEFLFLSSSSNFCKSKKKFFVRNIVVDFDEFLSFCCRVPIVLLEIEEILAL